MKQSSCLLSSTLSSTIVSFRRGVRSFHKMASVPYPVSIPRSLLNNALAELDQAETDRMNAGTSNQSNTNDTAYAGCSYTVKTSSDLANRKLNRWNNIFAYDHSLLPGPYLNASLIPPYPLEDSKPTPGRSYIASQAPLPQTLPTFYSSIIKHKVSLIVNLSPFIEHGRVKADEYWPLEKGQVWNSTPGYTVSHIKDPKRIGDQWKAIQYQLRISDVSKEEDYDFTLLHVTSWPDFGAFSGDIFAKLLTVIENAATGHDPLWIHCSAGIGRSGTVVAALLARDLGSSLESAMKLKPLTTPSLVGEAALVVAKKLVDHERRYRPFMVQTADQLGMIASAVGTLLQH